MISIPV